MAQYELNLRDYWLILRKRKWIIICTVLLVAGFTFIITELFSGKPLYEASDRVKYDRFTTLSGLMTEVFFFSKVGHNLTTQAEDIRIVTVHLRVENTFIVLDKEIDRTI